MVCMSKTDKDSMYFELCHSTLTHSIFVRKAKSLLYWNGVDNVRSQDANELWKRKLSLRMKLLVMTRALLFRRGQILFVIIIYFGI